MRTYRDVNVLDDNIAVTSGNAETLAFQNTIATNSNDALVGADINRGPGSIVIGARDPGAVVTSVSDPSLSCGSPALADSYAIAAALVTRSALRAGEVPGTVNQDGSGGIVRDPFDQPYMLISADLDVEEPSETYSSMLEGVSAAADPPPVVSAPNPNGDPVTWASTEVAASASSADIVEAFIVPAMLSSRLIVMVFAYAVYGPFYTRQWNDPAAATQVLCLSMDFSHPVAPHWHHPSDHRTGV